MVRNNPVQESVKKWFLTAGLPLSFLHIYFSWLNRTIFVNDYLAVTNHFVTDLLRKGCWFILQKLEELIYSN